MRVDPLSETDQLAEAMRGHGVVLCLAGVTDRAGDLTQNTDLALAAIRASAQAGGIPVLLSSSAAVYGNGPDAWKEDALLSPLGAYGEAKRTMEVEAGALAKALSVKICALRIGNVAGADAILAGWRAGFELDLTPGVGTPSRSYIGPRVFSEALASVAAQAESLPSALNIAVPGAVAMGDLLNAAGLPWTPRTPGPGLIEQVLLDTSRLAQLHRFSASDIGAEAIVDDWTSWQDMRGA